MSETKFQYFANDEDWAQAERQKELDRDAERKAKQEARDNRVNATYKFAFGEGRTIFRVMPKATPEKGKGWYEPFREHYKPVNKFVTCPESYDERCPLCEKGRELRNDGDMKAAAQYRSSDKFWVNAIILSEESTPTGQKDPCTPKTGVVALKLPSRIKTAILDLDTDKAGGYGDVTSLERGFNIIVERSGEGFDMYKTKAYPGRTNIIETLLNDHGVKINDLSLYALDKVGFRLTYEEIQSMMEQAGTTSAPVPAPTMRMNVVTPTVTPNQPVEVEAAPATAADVTMSNPVPVPVIPPPPTKRA